MYLVTGGAFQGKRKWVKQLLQDTSGNILWINSYEKHEYSLEEFEHTNIVVIEVLEELVRITLEENQREYWSHILSMWNNWEKQGENRRIIIIGCEVGLGIVPLNKEDRDWRDLVGWVYQDFADKSDIVVRIWCGLPEIIKGEEL